VVFQPPRSRVQQEHLTTASSSWAATACRFDEGKGSDECEGTSIAALVLVASLTRTPQKDLAAAQMRHHLAAQNEEREDCPVREGCWPRQV